MDSISAARCLEGLGNPHRLEVFRLLVQAGSEGLPVGRIREHLGMPGSTLSHHLANLVQRNLVTQRRESRSLICACNYSLMEDLIGFLTENCCRGASCCDESGAVTQRFSSISGSAS